MIKFINFTFSINEGNYGKENYKGRRSFGESSL